MRFPRAPRARRPRRGLSIVEVLIALLVLCTGLGAFTRTLIGATGLGRASREAALAVEGAHRMLERLAAEDFETLFARYNATADDDPAGVAPGPHFAIAGLDPAANDADRRVGEIRFPAAAGTGWELREDVEDPDLGMPRDLDGDGAIDALDHAGGYRFLPVEVRVRWKGPSGEHATSLRTVLARR